MWNNENAAAVNPNLLPRAEAIKKTFELARAKGYKDTFKVRYDGRDVVTPTDLPEFVDMTLIQIASVLNQA